MFCSEIKLRLLRDMAPSVDFSNVAVTEHKTTFMHTFTILVFGVAVAVMMKFALLDFQLGRHLLPQKKVICIRANKSSEQKC